MFKWACNIKHLCPFHASCTRVNIKRRMYNMLWERSSYCKIHRLEPDVVYLILSALSLCDPVAVLAAWKVTNSLCFVTWITNPRHLTGHISPTQTEDPSCIITYFNTILNTFEHYMYLLVHYLYFLLKERKSTVSIDMTNPDIISEVLSEAVGL